MDVTFLSRPRTDYLGDIDYRDEEPTACEYCGGPVHVLEANGSVYVSGPADLEWAAEYGITTEGWYRTRWYEWQCMGDADHYGPLLQG